MALSETDTIPVPPVTPGVARALSPLVRRVTHPGATEDENGLNTYLVGIDEIVIVDPGPINKEHEEIILGCGGDRIKWIVSTSPDPEYTAGALSLKKKTGAEFIAPIDAEGADQTLGDGFKVDATEFRLIAANLGRSDKKFAFILEQERLVLTGDNVPKAIPKGLIKKMKPFRVKSLAPGHGQYQEDIREELKKASA